MACDVREAAEAVEKAGALVCNLGAIEFVDSMLSAGQRANDLGIPVVFDPVAAGGTALRREASAELLRKVRFTAIRGNASEIRALAGEGPRGSGVDAELSDRITEENLPSSCAMVKELAERLGTVIAVSGKIDLVSDGEKVAVLRNGCATMARITGSGCMVTSLIGAFCGASPEEPFAAVCSAMTVMGIAGELSEEKMHLNGTGNATFRNDLIDAVFTMTDGQLSDRARIEIMD